MGTSVFVYGPLCHAPLRALVLGREVPGMPAVLPGRILTDDPDRGHPGWAWSDTGDIAGEVLDNLPDEALARLDYYMTCLGNVPCHEQVCASDTRLEVGFHLAAAPTPDGAAWSYLHWKDGFADVVAMTARDVMDLYNRVPAAAVQPRYGAMLVRGSSRLRAAQPAPTTHRHLARPGDVVIERAMLPYAHFFSVEEYDLRFRQFNGHLSPVINRAAFISGDAITVLPYDPRRDRVLLVEQFRTGPFARGDNQPWQLEAIAGRIDPFETPETAALREAEEEAGLKLGDLLKVAEYYTSTGAKSEYLYSYVALTDLPDGAAGVFGLADEAEDIGGHLIDFETLMAMIASGEVANAPLVLTAFWLQGQRARLRAGG